jgi:ketosteroid isomerase-like protein
MIRPLALTGLLLLPGQATESPDRAQVLEVVQRFFDSLAKKDMAALQATVLPGTPITTWRPTPEGTGIRRRTVEEDVKAIPANPEALLERMWNPTVLVQGRLATVWTPYDFHRNGRFSHSGTDVFTLVKTSEGWRIVSLVYTVEPDLPSAHPAGPPRP